MCVQLEYELTPTLQSPLIPIGGSLQTAWTPLHAGKQFDLMPMQRCAACNTTAAHVLCGLGGAVQRAAKQCPPQQHVLQSSPE